MYSNLSIVYPLRSRKKFFPRRFLFIYISIDVYQIEGMKTRFNSIPILGTYSLQLLLPALKSYGEPAESLNI